MFRRPSAVFVVTLSMASLALHGHAQTTRVSVRSDGQQGGDLTRRAAISRDGRFVAMASLATLVQEDTNGDSDVFVHDRLTGETLRVSVTSAGAQGEGASDNPAISADGRIVAFESRSADLVSGDTNGESDVFVHDRVARTTVRVSVAAGGIEAVGGGSFRPCLTPDGRFVVFYSDATNLVPGDTNVAQDVFVHDRQAATTTRVSVTSSGGEATGGGSRSGVSCASDDGRFITFQSDATNLVFGDTNAVGDVFVHDRQNGAIARVSVGPSGVEANGRSFDAAISPDGRRVAFSSQATNLVPGDTNGFTDIFVRDSQSGVVTRVNVASDGTQADTASDGAVFTPDGQAIAFNSAAGTLVAGDTNGVTDVFVRTLSPTSTVRVNVGAGGEQALGGTSSVHGFSRDRRYLVFTSSASNLVPGDTNLQSDAFVRDLRALQVRRASVKSDGTESDSYAERPVLSATGRFVAFDSGAATLVDGDTNGVDDVFVRDRYEGTTTRVSLSATGGQADGASFSASISADGRYVAFQSAATNLVPGDTNGIEDVFVHDRQTGATTRECVAHDGAQADSGECGDGVISADGRYVLFASSATNLVPGDTNNRFDIFMRDRVLRTAERVSLGNGGVQAEGHSFSAALSADNRFVVFASSAANLVPGDTNLRDDVFLRDLETGVTTRVSVDSGGVQGNGHSFDPSIGADGQYLAFGSDASNLVAGDTNATTDVFVHDVPSGVTTRVSVGTGGTQANGTGSDTWRNSLSADGNLVVFKSTATNLAGNDTNGARDAFVHDRVTGVTTRASLGEGLGQTDEDTFEVAISADGLVMAMSSFATNLVAGDTNSNADVFVRALTPEVLGVSPRSGPTGGGTKVRILGRRLAAGTVVDFAGTVVPFVGEGAAGDLFASAPMLAAGVHDVRVTVPGFSTQRLVGAFTAVEPTVAGTDTDGDGMTDAYETQYSLDPLDPSDGTRDDDGDGASNLEEAGDGTHPNGREQRHLAEGATGIFFHTELGLVNPGGATATALLTFLTTAGTTTSRAVSVPPRTRVKVNVEDVPGMESAEFSTVLDADEPLALERMMRWDGSGYGSHLEAASGSPALRWWLAEGATHSGFDLFYLLQNPNPTPTAVTIRFLRPAPLPPVVRSYTLLPSSRFNVWVDLVDPELADTDVSAVITATQPIMVERAMYRSTATTLFAAGHESVAVPQPAVSWFLAEGATGPYFDLFLLLANPGTSPAEVRATFLEPDGSTVTRTYTVQPESRFTIWVDLVDPALADTAVSTTIDVTNNVPIVVERAMWWPGSSATWFEAHNSAGARVVSHRWVAASGADGGSQNAETYLLIANTAAHEATARVTLIFDDGTSAAREFPVAPTSRFNVAVRAEFPAAAGRIFGAIVESVGLGAAPLVVEQSVYADAGGVRWQAGGNSLAMPLGVVPARPR